MVRDFEHRYRAVRSRDARFDGWFFVAVTSTGIYCRPSCRRHPETFQEVRGTHSLSEITQLYSVLLHFVMAHSDLMAADRAEGRPWRLFTTSDTNLREPTFYEVR
jgi:hypothetical protein